MAEAVLLYFKQSEHLQQAVHHRGQGLGAEVADLDHGRKMRSVQCAGVIAAGRENWWHQWGAQNTRGEGAGNLSLEALLLNVVIRWIP